MVLGDRYNEFGTLSENVNDISCDDDLQNDLDAPGNPINQIFITGKEAIATDSVQGVTEIDESKYGEPWVQGVTEIDESKSGDPWVQGLIEGDYFDLCESKSGDPWVQGLTEGDYFDLCVEDRVNALVTKLLINQPLHF